MNRETSLTATMSHRIPEDVLQAQMLVNSILSLNDEADVEPGELQGMSLALAHARSTWQKMRS